jgi:hypothetical protein
MDGHLSGSGFVAKASQGTIVATGNMGFRFLNSAAQRLEKSRHAFNPLRPPVFVGKHQHCDSVTRLHQFAERALHGLAVVGHPTVGQAANDVVSQAIQKRMEGVDGVRRTVNDRRTRKVAEVHAGTAHMLDACPTSHSSTITRSIFALCQKISFLATTSGLPPRPRDADRLRMDFMPFLERTIQDHGVVIDEVHYYHDALRRWIGAKKSKAPRGKRKFIFRRDPRDISVVWFYDPEVGTH